MASSACPSEQELRAFQLGDLPEPALTEVADHLEGCPRCEGQAQMLDTQVDPILSAIRSLPASEPGNATRALGRSASASESGPQWEALDRVRHEPVAPPRLRDYEITGTLGRGGMAVVYRARQLELNRTVALKMILGGAHAGAEEMARFQNEAEAVARLQHPNLMQIYEIGREEGQLFLALEYVDGGSLEDRLEGKPQPIRWSAELIETVARAIHYAHEQGIIHRDLKPTNILLTRDGTPKIADFGLAKQVGRDLTQTGLVAGTPSYMPPEQAQAQRERFGPTLDVYTLGVILYEMLTGKVPFNGSTEVDTLLLLLEQEPVPPRRLRPAVPLDLQTICLKCLQKDPRQRYASALELADDLRRFLDGEPIRARPVPVWERAWKWSRRRPLVTALLAGMVLIALAGLAGIGSQWREAVSERRRAESSERTALAARDQVVREREEKERQRQEAVRAQERAENNLYFSRIAQAQLEWRLNHDMSAAQALLNQWRPDAKEPDRRGWEWHYLHGLLHTDLLTLRAHESYVRAVAYSPNGRLLASAGGGNPFFASQGPESIRPAEIILWDADSGEKRAELRGAHANLIVDLAFRPDGRQLASAGLDHKIVIWDADTAKPLRTLTGPAPVHAVAYSPDGRRLASGHEDRSLILWDAATGKPIRVLNGHRFGPVSVAFNPNGRQLVSSSNHGNDGELIIWDADSGQEVDRLGTESVISVDISPDGRLLVAAGRSVTIWDLVERRPRHRLVGHAGLAVKAVRFRPDGRQVATAGSDRTVRLWNVASGSEEGIFRGHDTRPLCLGYDRTGRMLASGDEHGFVKVWDLTRNPEYTVLNDSGRTEALAFTSTGRDVQFLSHLGGFQTVDAVTGAVRSQRWLDMTDRWLTPATLASISGDGSRLATVSRSDLRVVRLWDTSTGKPLGVLGGGDTPPEQRHSDAVHQISFSDDGRWLATAAKHAGPSPLREVKVWNTSDGRLSLSALVPGVSFNGSYGALSLSADGKWLAVDEYTTDKLQPVRIKVCEVAKGERGLDTPRWTFGAGKAIVRALAFSDDGKYLAASDADQPPQVFLWDLRTGQRHGPPMQMEPQPFRLAFSPDGRRLAAVNREETKVWDVATGQEVLILRGAPPPVNDRGYNPQLAWSRDGKLLAASHANNTVSVWDTQDRDTPEYRKAQRAAARTRAFHWHLELAAAALAEKSQLALELHWKQVRDAEPSDLPSRLHRGRLHAAQGQWKPAATDYDLVSASPTSDNLNEWCHAACIQWLADDPAWRKTCQGMTQRFSVDERTAGVMVRTLALFDKPVAKPDQLVALARKVMASKKEPDWADWHILGLAQYRAGQHDEAERSCQRSLDTKQAPHLQPVNYLVLALACQRLGKADEARKWRDRAEAWLQEVLAGDKEHGRLLLRLPPSEALEFLILRREAARLLAS